MSSASSSAPSSDSSSSSVPRFTIYDDAGGYPSPLRVRLAIAELGLESHVTYKQVSLFTVSEHRSAEHRARNPTGTIPVLELDDGTYISECTAITMYLDSIAQGGQPSALTGHTAKEKAMVHMMQRRAEMGLVDAVGNYFHHATPGLGEKNKNAAKLPHWAARGEWGRINRDRAWTAMHYFDKVLQASPYVAGDAFSMADITVLAGLHFARINSLGIPPECTTLIQWHDRLYKEKYAPLKPYEANTPADKMLLPSNTPAEQPGVYFTS